ncbi:MAG: radical SAM protein [Anaerotruncus sp.]|nr:radical SAM protein [Anaerotruncus sp.]
MGWLKNFLKKFLPPPVKVFNREMNITRKLIQEENKLYYLRYHEDLEQILRVLTQQQEQINTQQCCLEAVACILQKIEANQQKLEQRLLELDQFADLEKFIQTEISSAQQTLGQQLSELNKFSELEKLLQTSIAEEGARITNIFSNEQELMKQTSANISDSLTDQNKMLVRLLGIGGQLSRIELGTKRMTPQPWLSYFVLNILDHCNLRCKGCDHFACIAEEHFVSIENIKRDVTRMSELLNGGVTRIGVMGGEPLLHPNLLEILSVTRKVFPNSIIQLVTNGLLLLKMSEEFWTCCCDNKIVIVNTRYPIDQDYERMQITAKEHKVAFEFYGNTGEVQKTSYKNPLDISGQQNPISSFWSCYHANNLCLLMEGKLYGCTIAPNIRHFNKKFGTHMELEPGDYLDIHNAQNSDELFNFLAKPKPFCRYCMSNKRTFGHIWERSKQEMSEWLPD